jgi:hypothetical protein
MGRRATSSCSGRLRALACAFAATLTLCTAVGLSATPASACTCVASTPEEHFERADVVFAGELVRFQGPPQAPGMRSTGLATWTFEVTEVFKGEATATQEVVSSSSGASCGLELPHEGTFVVYASRDALGMATGPHQLEANLCGGTQAGTPPAAFADLGRPPKPATEPAADAGAGGRPDDPPVPLAVAVAVAVAAAGIAAVAVALHRRRRPAA